MSNNEELTRQLRNTAAGCGIDKLAELLVEAADALELHQVAEYLQRPRIPLVDAARIRRGDVILRNDTLELVKRVEREKQTVDQARQFKPDILVWHWDRGPEPMHYSLDYQTEVWRPLGGEVQ